MSKLSGLIPSTSAPASLNFGYAAQNPRVSMFQPGVNALGKKYRTRCWCSQISEADCVSLTLKSGARSFTLRRPIHSPNITKGCATTHLNDGVAANIHLDRDFDGCIQLVCWTHPRTTPWVGCSEWTTRCPPEKTYFQDKAIADGLSRSVAYFCYCS